MLVVPDISRKFAAANTPVIDATIQDLFQAEIALKRANAPDWTDESAADFGMVLLWMYAVLSRWMADNIDRAKNNLYVATTQNRVDMQAILELLGYQLGLAAAASATVTFTCESGHPQFTIIKGTKVGTIGRSDQPAVVFETTADQIVNVGVDEVDVACIQGETVSNEVVGSSVGESRQEFVLSRRGVVWQSEVVEVFDGSWTAWTRADNFVESIGTDKEYRLAADENGSYRIIFGDGVNGAIPVRSANNIRVTYRVGGGSVGNVGAGSITQLISQVNYVESVTNAAAASGGTERETLDHARIFGPGRNRHLNRALNVSDTEDLVNAYVSADYGAIATAKATESGGFNLDVMVVPVYGGNPSAGFKAELQTYLNARRLACMAINVIDPTYIYVDVTVTIQVIGSFASSEVQSNVRQRVINFLSPTYQDPTTGLYPNKFGRNIYLSDLYEIINGTPGVDNCTITAPAGNTIVAEYAIADIGDLTINVSASTGQQSYLDLKKDRVTRKVT